jgi:hypothetical protein
LLLLLLRKWDPMIAAFFSTIVHAWQLLLNVALSSWLVETWAEVIVDAAGHLACLLKR